MWQPQPQNQRPRMAVDAIPITNSTKPALTMPFVLNSIDSDGSSGVMVSPVLHQ